MQLNKKWKIFFVVLVIIALVFYLVKDQYIEYIDEQPYFNLIKKISYHCDQEKSINAIYKYKKIIITLNDKRKLTLNQTLAASGIRYENDDGSIIFRSKSKEAYLQEKNIVTYKNCVEVNLLK